MVVVSSSGWLLEAHLKQKPSRRERAQALVHGRPLMLGVVVQAVVGALCWALPRFPGYWPESLSVPNPGSALEVVWQVQAAFASIAFAGLALMFQVASDGAVAARNLRETLVRATWFLPALGLSLGGTLQLGIITLWAPTSQALVIELACVVAATLLAVGYAYYRASAVFMRPDMADQLASQALAKMAVRSMRSAGAREKARSALAEVVPPHWDPKVAAEVVLSAPTKGTFADVRLQPLRALAEQIAAFSSSSAQAQGGQSFPATDDPEQIASLRLAASLGAQLDEGEPLFVLVNGGAYLGSRKQLARRLGSMVRWVPNA